MLPDKFTAILEALIYIAFKSGIAPVSGKMISQYTGYQPRYLEQELQQLVKHRILRASRGPKGGYSLARDRRKIALSEVLELVEKEEFNMTEEKSVSTVRKELLDPFVTQVNIAIKAHLSTITLEDLCHNDVDGKLTKQGIDFTI